MGYEEIHQENERRIQTQGFAVMSSFPVSANDPPPFSYTLGLTESVKHPELIVFGLPVETGHALLSDLAKRVIQSGEPLPVDKPIDDLVEALPLCLKHADADKALSYAAFTSHRYRSGEFAPQFLQLVWPDPGGRFPWDEGFEERLRASQPLLFSWT